MRQAFLSLLSVVGAALGLVGLDVAPSVGTAMAMFDNGWKRRVWYVAPAGLAHIDLSAPNPGERLLDVVQVEWFR